MCSGYQDKVSGHLRKRLQTSSLYFGHVINVRPRVPVYMVVASVPIIKVRLGSELRSLA